MTTLKRDKTMKTLTRLTYSMSLVFALGPMSVQAESVKMYDQAPSASEMGSVLFSKSAPASNTEKPVMKMRSISFGKPKNDVQNLPEPTAQKSKGSAIGLPIKFAYNSADILDESKPFLREIGKMMSMPEFANEKLLIEGHTDAAGSEQYNQYLSERRANSVKSYLRLNYQIASNRLFVTGMGESQPLEGVNPYDGVNRRVQFRKAP